MLKIEHSMKIACCVAR